MVQLIGWVRTAKYNVFFFFIITFSFIYVHNAPVSSRTKYGEQEGWGGGGVGVAVISYFLKRFLATPPPP